MKQQFESVDLSEASEQLNKETKQQLQHYQEEHSIEIRDLKRKQLLQKNRKEQWKDQVDEMALGSDEKGQKQSQVDIKEYPELYRYLQVQNQNEFDRFIMEQFPAKPEELSGEEQAINVKKMTFILLSPSCTPFLYGKTARLLYKYFDDEDPQSNISMYDIYNFIEVLLKYQFPVHASVLLSKWQEALIYDTKTEILREQVIGCLLMLCAISRGTEKHCMSLEEANLLPVIFDIFAATKTERDIAEIMIYTIGNLTPASPSWRIYFMSKDFHNIILSYLKFAPKTPENLILHRRICWCVSNLSRDYFDSMQNKQFSQIVSERTKHAQQFDTSIFNFDHISNLCATFAAYDDKEIHIDIAWAFPQLISICFFEAKKQIIGDTPAVRLTEEQKVQYKKLISEKIQFLMQNGLCEFVNMVLPKGDMTILTPVLRALNKIMTGNSDSLEEFFAQCYPVMKHSLQKNIQSHIKMIRKETISTLNHMFSSDLETYKPIWIDDFMPIILNRLIYDEINIREEIFKLISTIFDTLNDTQFNCIVFLKESGFFGCLRASLVSHEAKPESVFVLLNILLKILHRIGSQSFRGDLRIKKILNLIDSNNIPAYIETLQEHQLTKIYELSNEFIEQYNILVEIVENENMNEETQMGSLI